MKQECLTRCRCFSKFMHRGAANHLANLHRDNRVEGVNLGGNRAPARGRNRNSRPEPTPKAALAGFLGPAGMAGGSTGFGNCQGWGERAPARRSPALSIAQSETGTLPGSHSLKGASKKGRYGVSILFHPAICYYVVLVTIHTSCRRTFKNG